MAINSEGQLSFDWSQPVAHPVDAQPQAKIEIAPTAEVLCLAAHRNRVEENERSRHFSEILKLVAHLKA